MKIFNNLFSNPFHQEGDELLQVARVYAREGNRSNERGDILEQRLNIIWGTAASLIHAGVTLPRAAQIAQGVTENMNTILSSGSNTEFTIRAVTAVVDIGSAIGPILLVNTLSRMGMAGFLPLGRLIDYPFTKMGELIAQQSPETGGALGLARDALSMAGRVITAPRIKI